MIGGLARLGFAQPLVLLGLQPAGAVVAVAPGAAAPVLHPLSATRLLFDIAPKEETPARTPWWLTLLRLSLAALVILAAAGPL